MIAKRIARKADVADDFTRLGKYISTAPEKGEKLDRFWLGNCNAGETLEDLPAALAEIEAIRQQKPGVKDKTYHLVVSFRDSDRDKLTDEALKAIATAYVTALGFEGHQYVAGTHINTEHFHMHIGINKVHPQTLQVLTPYRDFRTLEQVSRAMEQKYGLEVDPGLSDRRNHSGLSPAARDFEARTWEQSFQRWMQDHHATLLPVIEQADSWPALHTALSRHGVRLKLRGAGLVFTDPTGKQRMKASAFDRSCSKAALEQRLGVFVPAEEQALPPRSHTRGYRRRPLVRHAATPRLWRQFLKAQGITPLRPLAPLPILHRKLVPLSRAVQSWHDFVTDEAYRDPLAAVVLLTHQEAVRMLLGPSTPAPAQSADPVRISGASLAALRVWRNATPWRQAKTRPAWAEKSRLGSPGVKVDDQGNLIVPFRTAAGRAAGRIEGIQLIAENGQTQTIGPVSRDSLYLIDPGRTLKARAEVDHSTPQPPGLVPELVPVLLADSYISAMALAQATGAAVAVARSPEDRDRLAVMLANQYHAAPTVVDHDGPPETARWPSRLTIPGDIPPADLRARCAATLGDAAMVQWSKATGPARRTNPVLQHWGVQSYGCREDDRGTLLVPLRTLSGRLDGVSALAPDGSLSQTINPTSGPLVAMIDPLRDLGTDRPILLAQDYPTAAALHRATRLPVLAVQDPADWQATAEAVKTKWPNASPVVAMDDTPTNREQAKAAGLPLVAPSGSAYTRLTGPKAAETLRDTLAEATGDAVWQTWRAGRTPASTDHPIMSIGTLRRGVRISDDGQILIPLRNEHQRLSGVMVVSADGETLHTVTDQRETPTAPLSHVISGFEKAGSSGPVIVARSVPEAIALHRETMATLMLTSGKPEDLARSLYGKGRSVLLAGEGLLIPKVKDLTVAAPTRAALRKALTTVGMPMRQERGRNSTQTLER